jgi:hypothetical protein
MIFQGRVIGDQEVTEMLKRAPKIYIRYMRNYLSYAGNTFVGSKKKDGRLRDILSRKSATRGGTWSRKFINAVARYEVDKTQLIMTAGIIYKDKKKIHEIMELMESGYNKNTSGYMIVPNRKEVKVQKAMSLFNQMINSNMLRLIFKRGNIYYINKDTGNLMFTGTKHIQIKPQFNFKQAWSDVEPKIQKKADSILDRATKAVEKAEAANG